MRSTSRRTNCPEKRWLSVILLTAFGLMVGCGSEEGRVNVVENFNDNGFDRSIWQMAQPAPDVGKVEIKDDAMVFTMPPAAKSRPQIRTLGKFAFTGDFEAMFDYSLLTPLPEAESEYVNVELVVYGEEFDAHLSRVNHHGTGDGAVAYFSPKLETLESHWTIAPTPAEQGTLKVLRTGTSMQFLHRPASGETFDELKKVECGSNAVKGLCIAVTVNTPTQKAFSVAIDNIAVRTIHEEVPLTDTVAFKIGLGVAGFLLIAGLGLWIARRSPKKRPGKAKATAKPAAGRKRRSKKRDAPTTPESVDDFDVT